MKTPDGITMECLKEATKAIEEHNDDFKREVKDNREHIGTWSNIPRRYVDAEFVAKTPAQEELIEKMRENYQGKGKYFDIADMLLYGDVGTGKTHIAIALLLKLIKANIYCKYTTEQNLLELYNQKKYDKFNKFRNETILVIDELGKIPLVDWQMIRLEELISYRYNEMLPTIFITNLDIKDFKEFVGDRIADRLRDNKIIRVRMQGESLRGKN